MKIGIVGAGLVGSTAGYTLVIENLVSELVFVDKNGARAEGEAMDVSHATPFSHPARVVAGSYEDLKDAADGHRDSRRESKRRRNAARFSRQKCRHFPRDHPANYRERARYRAPYRHEPRRRLDARRLAGKRSAERARHRLGDDFGHGAAALARRREGKGCGRRTFTATSWANTATRKSSRGATWTSPERRSNSTSPSAV